jgi:hypothetical protein
MYEAKGNLFALKDGAQKIKKNHKNLVHILSF